ncbi:glycosyl transferase [Niastella yeongjuensis]|uniref:Glycosyl transferase n=1 Tax=Niastella yeongjuensis TaxID=354355 RepID=A0A1V9EDK6_9BACT|nr:glycosyltransferase [Niastella yeongjuensis]OQP44198.1 glycosyl transferase [Niastella yeongjuensis]SEP21801.1 Glycosyltransferase involved in cell wall bisynthesis [Niastella yeongjuensis]
MTISHSRSKILFISTFPPVKCGIASFTQDLTASIAPGLNEDFSISICALDKKDTGHPYPLPVSMVMDSYNLTSCIETANKINKDPHIELVCIEHEFGLYGGNLGEFLLGFLALLEKPFIVRFHTVLPAPGEQRLKLVQKITLLADKIIVMTSNSARLLTADYQLDPRKIIIIPHGTPSNSKIGASDLKLKYDLIHNQVLTTFGLLSPNKGIEKGILAMKEISEKIPQAIYIVLGLTHPNLLQQEGEQYRNYLQQLIDDNNLQNNVRLVNEYVATPILMEYLALTDIYLFTSKDPDQAVSGTFIYAMSAGCPIISNSFALAKEMLDEHTGIIIEPGQEHALAENAIYLLQNKTVRIQMGHHASLKTKDTAWKKVAANHLELFDKILQKPVVKTELTDVLISRF